MSLYDLLPPNATTLERDFSRSTSSLERVGPAVPVIRTAKRVSIPDSVVPWLIYEYGLNELLPYLGNNPRRALAEGVPWQRVRGTPQALKIALGWINIAALVEESEAGTLRWAEFQLALDQPPNDLGITENLIGISRLSAPVRSQLFRVYSGYDHRRFLLNDHALSGGSWLSDHTGVYLRPDWPQLSFGRGFEREIDFSDEGVGTLGIERIHGSLGEYEDRFLLSHSLLDEFWHLSDAGASTRSRYILIEYGPLPGPGRTWESGTWETILGWAATNSAVPPYRFAKAGIYLSDQCELDDTNTCFSPRTEEEYGDGPFVLSDSALSEHVGGIRYSEILERLERTYRAPAAVAPPAPLVEVSLVRETRRAIDYDDNFILSQHRLDEWWHMEDSMVMSRFLTSTAGGMATLSTVWEQTAWNEAADWLGGIQSAHQTT